MDNGKKKRSSRSVLKINTPTSNGINADTHETKLLCDVFSLEALSSYECMRNERMGEEEGILGIDWQTLYINNELIAILMC